MRTNSIISALFFYSLKSNFRSVGFVIRIILMKELKFLNIMLNVSNHRYVIINGYRLYFYFKHFSSIFPMLYGEFYVKDLVEQSILKFRFVFFWVHKPCLGIDVRDIVEAASNYKKTTDNKKREELLKYMLLIIDQYVDDPRRQSNNRATSLLKKCFLMFFPSSGRYMGDYLRNLFIFVKILYLLNVFGQVLLLSFLLGQPFWSLGSTVLTHLYEGRSWDYPSRYFPKVTLW